MRVTNQMMAANVLTSLNSLRARTVQLTEQISSGKRISKASEDPTAGAEVMRLQSRMQVMAQWESNQRDARNWVESTEAALSEITDLINRARELAIQGSNATMTQETRQGMAAEAEQITNQLLALLNTKDGDRAIFGGFQTAGDPFQYDPVTGTFVYNGDGNDVQRDIGPGVTMAVNLHGHRFGNFADFDGDGIVEQQWDPTDNMLNTVSRLAADLKNGSENDIRAHIAKLDQALGQVISLRSETGARDKRLEQMETKLRDMSVQVSRMMEQAQGVDLEKAILELTNAETTYRAALQVGARVIPPTLADFLR